MRIGTMFDIPIRVHWSWLIGFVLITMLIASGGLPFISVRLTETQEWVIAGVVTLCLFLSVLAHELAHSLTAKRLGYSVISITLMIFGGVSLIRELRSRASHDFLIAAARPSDVASDRDRSIASLLRVSRPVRDWFIGAAAGDSVLHRVAKHRACGVQHVARVALDGGRVLQSAVWGLTGNRRFAARMAGRAGQVLAIAMIIAGVVLIIRNGDLTSGLWLMLIAMFILPSSTAETRRAGRNRREERVVGVPVRSLMTSVPTALSASTPLDAAVRNVLSRHPDTDIPVVEGGRVTGVASMRDGAIAGPQARIRESD